MAERNQAYQPFMSALQGKIDGLMQQIKSQPVPESLRHLPKVEKPAYKRKRGGRAKYSGKKRVAS